MSHGPTSPSVHHSSRMGQLLLVLAATAFCGWVDYVTGYEVSVFAVYALPLILSTRSFGLMGGCLSALLCSAVWIAADVVAGHLYGQWWVVYWNALHRFVFFLCVALGFHYARAALGAESRRWGALTRPWPVCTQCHRIAAKDGHWHRLESYLCEHAGTPPMPKVCPDCARESYAMAGFTDRTSHR